VLDATNGVMASVSVFETQAQLEQADHRLAMWMADHLAASSPCLHEARTGEVIIQKGLRRAGALRAKRAEMCGIVAGTDVLIVGGLSGIDASHRPTGRPDTSPSSPATQEESAMHAPPRHAYVPVLSGPTHITSASTR
jgi:hypothetical protein